MSPRVLALICLLAVFLFSAPARAQGKREDKSCDKPAVTLGPDGKTPTVDPLPEIPSRKEDHVDWPVLDRAAYQRLTVVGPHDLSLQPVRQADGGGNNRAYGPD
ncbi:hypothetical protein JCM15519_14690 [Fundidesulfovibrio butyratiphilus]